MEDSFIHLFIHSLVGLFGRRNLDLKSIGLQSSKYKFCSNIKVSDTGFIAGPHWPAALDVDSHCKIQENSVIATSSDGRDSTIQLVHDSFIQKHECVDYRC